MSRSKNKMIMGIAIALAVASVSFAMIMESENASAETISSVTIDITNDFDYHVSFPTVTVDPGAKYEIDPNYPYWDGGAVPTSFPEFVTLDDIAGGAVPTDGYVYRLAIRVQAKDAVNDPLDAAANMTVIIKIGGITVATLTSGFVGNSSFITGIYVWYLPDGSNSFGSATPSSLLIDSVDITSSTGPFNALGDPMPVYSVGSSADYDIDSVVWQKASPTGWVATADTAHDGTSAYRARIALEADAPYVFSNPIGSVSVEVDGTAVTGQILDANNTMIQNIYVWYLPDGSVEYGAATPSSLLISSADITSSAGPFNSLNDPIPVYSAGSADYDVSSVVWQKSSPAGWVATTDTVHDGTSAYRAILTLNAEAPHVFNAPIGSVSVKVDGTTVTGQSLATNNMVIQNIYIWYFSDGSVEYGTATPEFLMLDSIHLTSSGPVVAGQPYPTYSADVSADYTVIDTEWMRYNGTSWPASPDAEPQEGYVYIANIILNAKGVYTFAPANSVIFEVDGENVIGGWPFVSGNSFESYYYPKCDWVILNEDLSALKTVLSAGELPEDALFGSVLPEGVELYEWVITYGGTNVGTVPPADSGTPLTAGLIYTVKVTLTTANGYSFIMPPNATLANPYYMNGMPITVSNSSNATGKPLMTYTGTFIAKTLIGPGDIDLNIPGKIYDGSKVSSYALGSNSSLFAAEYKWYKTGSAAPMAAGEEFAEGSEYYLEVKMTPKENAVFDANGDYLSVDGTGSYQFSGNSLILVFDPMTASAAAAVTRSAPDDGGSLSSATVIIIFAVVIAAAAAAAIFILRRP